MHPPDIFNLRDRPKFPIESDKFPCHSDIFNFLFFLKARHSCELQFSIGHISPHSQIRLPLLQFSTQAKSSIPLPSKDVESPQLFTHPSRIPSPHAFPQFFHIAPQESPVLHFTKRQSHPVNYPFLYQFPQAFIHLIHHPSNTPTQIPPPQKIQPTRPTQSIPSKPPPTLHPTEFALLESSQTPTPQTPSPHPQHLPSHSALPLPPTPNHPIPKKRVFTTTPKRLSKNQNQKPSIPEQVLADIMLKLSTKK